MNLMYWASFLVVILTLIALMVLTSRWKYKIALISVSFACLLGFSIFFLTSISSTVSNGLHTIETRWFRSNETDKIQSALRCCGLYDPSAAFNCTHPNSCYRVIENQLAYRAVLLRTCGLISLSLVVTGCTAIFSLVPSGTVANEFQELVDIDV